VDQALQVVWLGCIAWVIPTMIGVVALGAALLTVFGSRDYPSLAAVPAPATVSPAAELPVVDEAPAEQPPATE
jgi:hypothetical protein